MKIAKGMFLTEILIFLFLFSFFSLLFMKFIATTIATLAKISKKHDQIATITSALDWLIRDVESLDSLSDNILVKNGKKLKINYDSQRITWKLSQGKLLRVLQKYDDSLHTWKNPYFSLVAYPISDLSFEPIYNKISKNKIQGFICTLSGQTVQNKKFELHQTLVLRNGLYE